MQPNSIAKLFAGIGYKIIRKARVLEVGCGQGYLMTHLLNARASHVIGIDLEQSILDGIPMTSYEVHTNKKRTSEFKVVDFGETDMTETVKKVDIMTMFIGIYDLVEKLLDLFMANENVKAIAFMIPSRRFNSLVPRIEDWCQTYGGNSCIINIALHASNEQRRAMILKRQSQ
jgi:SAM-dependent methyltransferase